METRIVLGLVLIGMMLFYLGFILGAEINLSVKEKECKIQRVGMDGHDYWITNMQADTAIHCNDCFKCQEDGTP